MALLTPEFIDAHPVKAGLAWTAGFVPLMGALLIVTGRAPSWLLAVQLIGLSLVGGQAWSLALRTYRRRTSK